MKKNKVLILVVLLLLVLIIVFVFMGRVNKGNSKSTPSANQEGYTNGPVAIQNKDNNIKGNGSLKDLIGFGRNLSCTVTISGDKPITETMYVSGMQMRADLTIPASGDVKQMDTHMILDGDEMYSWTSQATVGSKMNLKSLKETVGTSKTSSETQADNLKNNLDQKMNYTCAPWDVDKSYFVVPTSITFTDLTAQMNDVQKQFGGQNLDNVKKNACSACDSLSGDAQLKCKQSLGC